VGEAPIFSFLSRNEIVLVFRLVLVVVCLYLTLIHVTSDFSLPLVHYGSSSRL
jgi:hypothetical protein